MTDSATGRATDRDTPPGEAGRQMFQCPACPQSFPSPQGLAAHKRYQHGPDSAARASRSAAPGRQPSQGQAVSRGMKRKRPLRRRLRRGAACGVEAPSLATVETHLILDELERRAVAAIQDLRSVFASDACPERSRRASLR